ncbi:MAG TPA: hypothetical protein VFJ96_07255 [Gemmatimonadaceae bacterium]|nr:hypothetical protein [Gemmatimonadaceae bacterium]
MTMLRVMAVGVVLMGLEACSLFGSDGGSIAGQYDLVTVNGQALPCCSQTDSAGIQATILAGSLTLGSAAPERYVATPGGMAPSSCVHEVPNGSHVDTSGTVTRPDSSTYKIPPCGDGTYTMVITRRYGDPNGASQTASDTSSGRYAWSSSSAVVSLLTSGMGGSIERSGDSVSVTVQAVHAFPLSGASPDLQYEFTRVSR